MSGDTEEFKEKKPLSPEFESELSVLNLQEILSLSRLWGSFIHSTSIHSSQCLKSATVENVVN